MNGVVKIMWSSLSAAERAFFAARYTPGAAETPGLENRRHHFFYDRDRGLLSLYRGGGSRLLAPGRRRLLGPLSRQRLMKRWLPLASETGVPPASRRKLPCQRGAPSRFSGRRFSVGAGGGLIYKAMNRYFMSREVCPACGASAARLLYRSRLDEDPLRKYLEDFYLPQGCIEHEYLAGGEYVLFECSECGLVYQGEAPGAELMERIYQKWIDPAKALEFHKASRPLSYYQALSGQVVSVVKHLGGHPGELLFLDHGMGWGSFCLMAAAHGVRCHGTELCRTRIEYAKSAGVEVIEESEISGHEYDFINLNQVLEHLASPAAVVDLLTKSLKRDGLIRMAVPNGSGIKKKLEAPDWTADKESPGSLNPVAPLEHLNCFDRQALLKFAKRFGLAPVYPATGANKGPASIVSKAKNLLRPLYHRLTSSRAGRTDLYFAKAPEDR